MANANVRTIYFIFDCIVKRMGKLYLRKADIWGCGEGSVVYKMESIAKSFGLKGSI